MTKAIAITGGTGALGTAVVTRMAQLGAPCHVAYVEEAELEGLSVAPHVHLHRVDCTHPHEVAAFYDQAGPMSAAIHLVGGFHMADIGETSLGDLERMWRLNTVTAFLCCQAAVAQMREHGGRIVNVAARPVVQPTGGMTAYVLAKAGVAALTQSLAVEVKPDNILVNAVLPSIMDTPANRKAMPDADHAAWPKVQEVAETIAFLAGEGNRLTSGALVPVFGRA